MIPGAVPLILAAGLSPAWQQVLTFDHFAVGEVNRAIESQWYGAGKSLNVAMAASHLGAAACLISPLGGPARESIEDEFEDRDITTRWIGTESPLRVCTTLLDRARGVTTELVVPAPPLQPSELAEFSREFAIHATKATVVVLSGSLAAGVPTTFYRDLLEKTACRAIVDARGEELLAALEKNPFLVKPNHEELAKTLRRNLDDDRSLGNALCEIRERGAQWVVVTDGKRPVVVSGPDGNFRLTCPPVERVVNPIGSGDCMAAGIAVALADGRDVIDSIRYGLGAAADNVGQRIAARIDPARVAALAQTVRTDAIS